MTSSDFSNKEDLKNRSNENQLAILEMRLHIVEALLTACENSQMVKSLIEDKNSEDKLIETFSFSKDQAQSIIDLKVPIDQIEQSRIINEIERLKEEIVRVKEKKKKGSSRPLTHHD